MMAFQGISFIVLILLVAPFLPFISIFVFLRVYGFYLRRSSQEKRAILLDTRGTNTKSRVIVGFFHPFCNAGGGGERVLWAAIRATQKQYPEALCVVYAGDCANLTKVQIVEKVASRFAIKLDSSRLYFVHLTQIRLVSAQLYPHFTLLGQSLGSLVLALDAFHGLVPDIFVDTMGYGFTLPLAKLLLPGIPVGAYVHYPTISTDMLGAIPQDAGFKTTAKRIYWKAFAGIYSLCGKGVDVIMANSSWTAGHMRALWGGGDPKRVSVVFPPCAVEEVASAVRIDTPREKRILCIAQFRPEKKHDLIIEAFSKFIKSNTEASQDARLVLVGSVRHSEDAMRVYDLRLQTIELGLREMVDFVLDSSWEEVLGWLGRCSVGTNAMWNEHFGIGVVEYQAAGLVSVVHASGGPKMDIVIDYEGGPTGFHAKTAEEFAEGFEKALSLPEEEIQSYRQRARASAHRFTENVFADEWIAHIEKLFNLHDKSRRH